VIEECGSNSQFKQRVRRAIAAVSAPKSLSSLVKRQLAGLARGTKFYPASAAGELSDKLDEVRRAILSEVAPLNVGDALELCERFLAIHSKVFERVDDSFGVIWPVFTQAIRDFATLYGRLENYDRRRLAETVLAWYTNDNYGIYDKVIQDFGNALGDEGLNRLEELLKQNQGHKDNTVSLKSLSHQQRVGGLLQIADVRRNVDEYITLIQTELGNTNDYQLLGIAERLLLADRCEEALEWLEKIDKSSHRTHEKQRLQIQALEGLGKAAEAQELRIEKFLDFPDIDSYKECLTSSESSEQLKEELLQAATTYKYPSITLFLFTNLGEIKRAAALVRQHREVWNGRNYRELQPAAKQLAKAWPLEATILYRALIEDIVERARSKYYHHAVRYLKALESLTAQIDDWEDIPTHEMYFDGLRESHKRKRGLWSKYDSKK
ncbi:MAG: DUF6880 family protein, partial [Cyanobacteria bacterium J06597_1]